MRSLFTLLVVMLFCNFAYSQDQMRVGDEVQYRCNCFGQEWVKGTVERVAGGNARIRYGNLDNQVANLPVNSPLIRRLPKPEDPQVLAQRLAFRDAGLKYQRSVNGFANAFDAQYPFGGAPLRPEEWQRTMTDLAELDSLCKGPYRGVTDFTDPTYSRQGSTDYRFGTWCQIAAKRKELEPIVRSAVAKSVINLGYTEENLNFGFNEPDNPVRMETQELIWERPKWRAAKIAWLTPKYAEYGTAVPPDATAAAEKRADQLRAIVERDAPNRSWKQPKYHDAAVESFVKAKFASQFPGSQVLQIGLDYTTWVQRKSLDYIASDDTFNYYKVSYNSYKRGSVLLKIPGRPFCQMQEWVVGKGSKGLVAAGMGGSGTFMRCA
ncbi:MAG: hypothetical protein QM785_16150 [Pyrinomonadaceae bacterium]